MSKAYINEYEVEIRSFNGDTCLCYVKELGITNTYLTSQIEVRNDRN